MSPPVRCLGVDLAWGQRGTTGLAALDAEGRLLDLADARTDDEVVAWARRWGGDGEVLVGVDAPVVVTNATGRRPAEAAVGALFARAHAGCHPSNLAKPEFADGTRAQRLADRLGWEVTADPPVAPVVVPGVPAPGVPAPGVRAPGVRASEVVASGAAAVGTARRRVWEVYPHPATVVLFGLERIIPYKHKQGRDLASLRAAMLVLVGHLEGLERADPPLRLRGAPAWDAVVAAVRSSTRKADLKRVEDRVDAVVCAYVALLLARAPHRVRALGDAATGAIVVPVDDRLAALVDAPG